MAHQAIVEAAHAKAKGTSAEVLKLYANGLAEQVAVLLQRSLVNLGRQRNRLFQSYMVNLVNYLFLGIVFLGLRISVDRREEGGGCDALSGPS